MFAQQFEFVPAQQWQEREPPPEWDEKPSYNELETSNAMFMIIAVIVIIWLMLRKSKFGGDKT